MAFVDWAADLLEVTEADRLANHAPLQFDLSVFDLYAAFRAGASVHLVPDRATAGALVDFIDQKAISVWYSVPSALVLMMEYGRMSDRELPALRAVLFAGEVFPINPLRRLRQRRPGLTLVNLYGPTETNVCAFFPVGDIPADQTSPVPIGSAACGDHLHVMRPDGSAAAVGEEGELVVEGPTVMMGYRGRRPQFGRYETGDMVRLRADGDLDYLGRRDRMVKVRGQRIELGEIESVLCAVPGIVEAVVVVGGSGHRARLTGFLVSRDGEAVSSLSLRRHLSEVLPRHMIVDRFRWLDAMPRNANGKTDRQYLQTAAEEESA
ncbi:AMP-binding protein [Kribbella sp. NBC_00359]